MREMQFHSTGGERECQLNGDWDFDYSYRYLADDSSQDPKNPKDGPWGFLNLNAE